MAATAITTTAQNIVGDFDVVARGLDANGEKIILLKSLGSTTTNWVPIKVFTVNEHAFIKNTGTNSYKLQAAAPASAACEFNQ